MLKNHIKNLVEIENYYQIFIFKKWFLNIEYEYKRNSHKMWAIKVKDIYLGFRIN